jgi:hypothetical protein
VITGIKYEPENNRFIDVDLHNRRSGIGSFFGTLDFGLNVLETGVKVIGENLVT